MTRWRLIRASVLTWHSTVLGSVCVCVLSHVGFHHCLPCAEVMGTKTYTPSAPTELLLACYDPTICASVLVLLPLL